MSYIATHLMGNMEKELPPDQFGRLYDEMQTANAEHASVSIRHESEWSLAASRSGGLIWENVELSEPPPCHMKAVPREKVLALWALLARGDIAAIAREPWLPGYE